MFKLKYNPHNRFNFLIKVITLATALVTLSWLILSTQNTYVYLLSLVAFIILLAWTHSVFFKLPLFISTKDISFWLRKKPNAIRAHEVIIQDDTRILREDNDVSVPNFSSDYLSHNKHHYVFITLTITEDINFLQLVILGKLRQLQELFFKPVIYLVRDKEHDRLSASERVQIENSFIRLIKYYLGKYPHKIINFTTKNSGAYTQSNFTVNSFNTNKKIMDILYNTTLGEIKNVLKNWESVNDSTSLLQIMLPIIEILNVYSIQEQGTAVLCGNNLLEFWRFGNDKLGIIPLIFTLPALLNIDGSSLETRKLDKNVNLFCATENNVKEFMSENISPEALLQIYSFMFFNIPITVKNLIEIKKSSGGVISFETSNDIRISLSDGTVSIEELKNDLITRLPIAIQKINKYVYGRNIP